MSTRKSDYYLPDFIQHPRMSKLQQKAMVSSFDPKRFVTHDLKEIDILLLKEAFDMYDVDGNGVLAPNEIV